MKKIYFAPQLELVHLDKNDVIATSKTLFELPDPSSGTDEEDGGMIL